MARRTTWLNDQTEAYIDTRNTTDSSNISGHINAAFEQLATIFTEQKPELGEAEMAEICNIYAGSELTRISLPVNIAADLLTHYGATLPSQLPEHCRPLVERLALMSQTQQLALIDAVRIFWASQQG